jgi:hypothetical protein
MVLVLLACAQLAASLAGAAEATTPTREQVLRSRTDAQLAELATRWDAEATRIGELLLADDAHRDELRHDEDVAQGEIARFLADAYKGGETGGLLAELLASGSLQEATDRVQIAEVITDHHRSLLRQLDRAETQLEVSELERTQLIAKLSAAQAILADVTTEQARRTAHRAEVAADREAARQAAAEKTAREQAASQAAVPGGLVSSSPFVFGGGVASAAGIDAYLASKASPMTGQGAAFMASGQRWSVDPRLLVAIAGAESNFGQITCGPNNAWGWACPNDPADFATWAAGIDSVTSGLRQYYLDEGRTSVSLIQQKYCPVGAANDPTGLNNHWATNVTRFLVEQGGNPAMVGPGPSAGALQLPSFGSLGFGD